MPLALLLTLVGISLSALLVPVVVNQMTATRTASERVQALHAAQAGVDVAVGQIRAAADAAGNGLVERLPSCELAGSLFPEDGKDSPRYRVGITYYDAAGGDLGCAPTDVPATASIESTGTEAPDAAFAAGTAGTRTIKATYAFQTTNANIVGGAIPVAQPASPQLCMDAGPEASPKAGTLLQMQKCQPGASRQRFAYTEDLSLKLVGSETPETEGAPLGMCLDAGSPQKTGANVVFQPCKGRTPQQQWSLNDNSNFQGTGNGVTMNSFCFNLKNPGAPGGVVLGSCGTTLNRQVFRAQTGVGTGMAGAPTGQLVNFRQFSRCMDVTDFTVTRPYMIVWFCKQAPDGNVRWNQKWLFPKATPTGTTGRIRTVNDAGAGYCLRSPASTAANQYVTLAACTATGTLASNLTWTLYGSTGDYTTSYRIVDHYGNCLTPTDLDALQPDTHSDGTSKAKVAVCDSSELQKWNAPANLNRPLPLTDITEK
ncbi:beta-galactoside-specific lectin 3 [Planomonospora sphaerica]|uniref:Beta-galactoside-specific lectin 3 n=2 Tax=Planomonospora sphaerica TaxID=161355 RepID=A0A161LBA0_9ACTN|nr:beta-galactoside-specific lectin 3 [Planomonospora sphaerica]